MMGMAAAMTMATTTPTTMPTPTSSCPPSRSARRLAVGSARPGALAALVAALTATAISASAAGVEDGWLAWQVPADMRSCGPPAAFEEAVARRLGQAPPLLARRARVKLAVRIARQPSSPEWSGDVEIMDQAGVSAGRRHVVEAGESCRPLVETLALVASLALGGPAAAARSPDGSSGSSTPAASDSPRTSAMPSDAPDGAAPPPEASRPAPPSVSPELAKPTDRPADVAATAVVRSPSNGEGATATGAHRSLALEAGALGGVGLLPAFRPGATLALLLDGARGPLTYLSLGLWSDGKVTIGAGDRGATVGLMQAAAGGCPIGAASHAFTWRACVTGYLGRLSASGFGFASSTTLDRWTGGAGANLYARRYLTGRFYVAGVVEVDVPILRSRVAFEDTAGQPSEIFRVAPVAGTASVRAGFAFD